MLRYPRELNLIAFTCRQRQQQRYAELNDAQNESRYVSQAKTVSQLWMSVVYLSREEHKAEDEPEQQPGEYAAK